MHVLTMIKCYQKKRRAACYCLQVVSYGFNDVIFVLQARPLFKDRRKFSQMADPMLQGQYPVRGLYQALAVAAMCVQEQPTLRPLIADVVTALSYLASQKFDPESQSVRNSRSGSSTPRTRR